MGKLHIRPATSEDVAALAELKCTYVRNLYRGFISQSILNRSTPPFHANTLNAWLANNDFRIALAERDGVIIQFVVYGNNPDAPYNGLLYEGVCDHLVTTTEEKRAMVNYCLDDLRAMGHSKAYLWILVDNFRVRYLFESLGFRPDGAREVREMFGQELRIARYVYPLS